MRPLNPQTSTRNLRPPPAATSRVPVVITTPPPPPGQPSRSASGASKTSTPSPTTTLASGPLLATRKRRPSSALLPDGRPSSRHSSDSSSPSPSQRRRPVTATATISTPSSRQSTLSQTLSQAETATHANGSRPPPHLTATADPLVTASIPATTCPTGSKRFSLLRAPLVHRDHNACSGDMTRPTKTFTATMAPEKGPPSIANSRQPSLAPSVAKSFAGRPTPRTPKVATPSAQPRIAQPTTATTGQQPRVAQPGATTPLARRSQQQGTGQTKDEYASPVSSFLNSNITPRSGSRQSRVDSNNNSPCGTPAPETGDGWDPRLGLGLSALDGDHPARKAGPFSPPAGEAARDGQAGAVESKFFFASDAKGSQPKQPAAPPPRSGGNFFYANGGAVENKQNGHANGMRSASPSFGPALSHTYDSRSSKFIYANGIPDLSPGQGQAGPSRPLSAVSTTSRMTTGRINQGSQPSSIPYLQRPTSPVKMASQPSLSSHWGSSQPLPTSPRPPNTLAQSALSPSLPAKRKSSMEIASQKAHSRSGSLSSPAVIIESLPLTKGTPSRPSSEVSSPSGFSSPTMMTLASPLQSVEERFAEAESSLEALHSPTKAAHPDDQLSDMIANARRDRKVQDLEITVTSLSAINRSLERRLRKQAVELRAYRRLSRAGRLSLLSTASVIDRESLASEAGAEGFGLSDLSEEEPEEEWEEESDVETDSGSEELTPEARAARDARHREKDERRLELDLSKHREQLINSQKINQSLKRCLNWTEELISEGSRALAYQVHANDVKLGGRVLIPEDDDDDDDDDDVLADSEHGDDTLNDLSIVSEEDGSLWAKEAQVRDSGLECPPEGG